MTSCYETSGQLTQSSLLALYTRAVAFFGAVKLRVCAVVRCS